MDILLSFVPQSFAGFLVGAIVGFTGVGGGSLMTPLLVLLFGIAPATAIGTDLLYAGLTKSGGAWVHTRQRTVDWPVVVRLAAGSVPSALLTIGLLHWLGTGASAFGEVLTTTLGVALVLTALALFARSRIAAWGKRFEKRLAPRLPLVTFSIGAVLGVLVTLSSVGAGALGVAALFLLYPGMAAARIVGTDIAHAVPLTLVAGLGHATFGTIDIPLLIALLAGSLPGIALGAKLARRLPERIVRSGLALLLLALGGRLIA